MQWPECAKTEEIFENIQLLYSNDPKDNARMAQSKVVQKGREKICRAFHKELSQEFEHPETKKKQTYMDALKKHDLAPIVKDSEKLEFISALDLKGKYDEIKADQEIMEAVFEYLDELMHLCIIYNGIPTKVMDGIDKVASDLRKVLEEKGNLDDMSILKIGKKVFQEANADKESLQKFYEAAPSLLESNIAMSEAKGLDFTSQITNPDAPINIRMDKKK
jgi:CheY-like chemotaxis protein